MCFILDKGNGHNSQVHGRKFRPLRPREGDTRGRRHTESFQTRLPETTSFSPFFGSCCGYGDCTTSWKDKGSLRESLHDLKDLLIRSNEYCNYFDIRFEKYSLHLLLKNCISTSQLLERAGLSNLHLSTMISIFFSRQIVGYI